VDVFIRNVLTVAPASMTFTGPNQNNYIQVTETGNPSFTVVSSNQRVATVIGPFQNNMYVITSHSPGKCLLTAYDPIGNSFSASVTVL
jgi:hypothetical protein